MFRSPVFGLSNAETQLERCLWWADVKCLAAISSLTELSTFVRQVPKPLALSVFSVCVYRADCTPSGPTYRKQLSIAQVPHISHGVVFHPALTRYSPASRNRNFSMLYFLFFFFFSFFARGRFSYSMVQRTVHGIVRVVMRCPGQSHAG